MEILIYTLIVFLASLSLTYIICKIKFDDFGHRGPKRRFYKFRFILEDAIDCYIKSCDFYRKVEKIDVFINEGSNFTTNKDSYGVEALVFYKDKLGQSLCRYIQFNINGFYEDYCLASFIRSFSSESFKSSSGFGFFVRRYPSFDEFFSKYKLDVISDYYIDLNMDLFKSLEGKEPLKKNITDFSYDIKNEIFEAKKLAENIDDIDIDISISELAETTDILLDFIGDKDNINEFERVSSSYEKSVEKILKTLKNFKSLKDSDSLSEQEELKLQDIIDEEIKNCSELINL